VILPTATLLGGGLLAVGILAASALGWLHVTALASMLLVVALAVHRRIPESLRLLRRAGEDLMASVPLPLLGLFTGVTIIQFTLSLAPPSDYDSLMYHVDLPVEFLRAGTLHLPIDNPHVAQIGLVHMLYLPLIALSGYTAAAALEVALALLVALVMLTMIDEVAGRSAAGLAFATVWGTTAFTLAAETPKIDVALVLYLLAGQNLVLLAARTARPLPAVSLAGVLVGLGVGVKLHAALYAVALAPFAVTIAGRGGSRKERARTLLVFAAGIAIGALPWLLKNGLMLGAPMYPLFSRALPPLWLTEHYAPAGPLELAAPLAGTALSRARSAVNMLDLLFSPGHLTAEAEGRMYFLNPLTLAAPLAVVAIPNGRALAFALPPVLYLVGLLGYSRHLNLRYLLPTLVPLAALGAAVCARFVQQRIVSSARTAVLVLVGTAAMVPTLLVLAWQLSVKHAPAYLLHHQSISDYLQGVDDYEIRSHMNIVNWVNDSLGPGSRVLMLFEGRGLYFQVPVLQDNILTNWPFLVASDATTDCLTRAGITHVLVGQSTLRYFTNRGLDPDDLRWGEFAAFKDRCLSLVHDTPDYALYRVCAR
jgi:hypothetical protein